MRKALFAGGVLVAIAFGIGAGLATYFLMQTLTDAAGVIAAMVGVGFGFALYTLVLIVDILSAPEKRLE
jgi:hypothetical protein